MRATDGPHGGETGAEEASAGLTAMVDESAFLSAEQQAHAAGVIGECSWDVDATRRTLTFSGAGRAPLVARAHLIGTAAPGPGTWLWGWEDVNGFPDEFVAAAERVRAAGEARGVPELTTAEVALTEDLPLLLATAAKTATGLAAHYSAPIDGGTRVWLLMEHPDFALPAPTVMRTIEAIGTALGSGVRDHRGALTAWARQRGARLGPATDVDDLEDGQEAVLVEVDDGALVVVLDAQGRIAGLRARLTDRTAFRDDASAEAARPGLLRRLLGRGR